MKERERGKEISSYHTASTVFIAGVGMNLFYSSVNRSKS